MSLRILFTEENTVVKNRFLGFLIWQSIQSTAILAVLKPIFFYPFDAVHLSLSVLFSFLVLHLALLLFSVALFVISSPRPLPSATPIDLVMGFVRFVFFTGVRAQPSSSPEFRSRARVSLSFVLFVAASTLSGFLLMVCFCWNCDLGLESVPGRVAIGIIGSRGLVVGLFYGLYFIYKRRWVLEFPIIQRPPFFSFKMGLSSNIRQALKISTAGYLVSTILAIFLPKEYTTRASMGKLVSEQFIFYLGSSLVVLCWELCHHLYQVLHTKRFVFAPPKGSAAAETNPSEPLLASLEESAPKSLLQYLAYLDLCMVSKSNVDTWRRAAFFEETGETYKRVMSVCLRPLEQFTLKLGEGLESCSHDSPFLSHQLRSPTDGLPDFRFYELFYDFQLHVWCARTVALLTACSHKEDRFGVAQLSGSNASVISTLISCLLAVETLMGKKTNLQSPHYLMSPAGIKWATVSSGKRDSAVDILGKKRGTPLYSKAYSMADVLRNSLYCIVDEFHDEMLKSAVIGVLDKDWIISDKPLYGTRELLIQKLRQFLDFQAC